MRVQMGVLLNELLYLKWKAWGIQGPGWNVAGSLHETHGVCVGGDVAVCRLISRIRIDGWFPLRNSMCESVGGMRFPDFHAHAMLCHDTHLVNAA